MGGLGEGGVHGGDEVGLRLRLDSGWSLWEGGGRLVLGRLWQTGSLEGFVDDE